MTELKIYGITEFSTPIICSAEVLGRSIEITIGGQIGTLTFPSLPEWQTGNNSLLFKQLLGPEPARSWKRGDELIVWGHPVSYPDKVSEVDRALIEFTLSTDNLDNNTQEIYDGFGAWLELFQNYVILLTTQNTRCKIVSHDGPGRLELYSDESNKLKMIQNNKTTALTVYMSNNDEALNFEQLLESARISSALLPPKFEYVLLLESYKARRNRDFRKSIIEAANALEVCLTTRILDEFSQQGISFGEKLLQKFRMLGGRFELIKLLGISLPEKDYENLIIKPRNTVVHRGIFPDQRLANQVITEVEDILDLFSPQVYQTPEV